MNALGRIQQVSHSVLFPNFLGRAGGTGILQPSAEYVKQCPRRGFLSGAGHIYTMNHAQQQEYQYAGARCGLVDVREQTNHSCTIVPLQLSYLFLLNLRTLTCTKRMLEFGSATRKSQEVESSAPPPIAAPSSAATLIRGNLFFDAVDRSATVQRGSSEWMQNSAQSIWDGTEPACWSFSKIHRYYRRRTL